jgi:hypothetical protein
MPCVVVRSSSYAAPLIRRDQIRHGFSTLTNVAQVDD